MKESLNTLDLPESNDVKEESLEEKVKRLEYENKELKKVLEEISAELKHEGVGSKDEIITNLLKEIGDLRFEKKISDIEKVTDDLTGLKKRNFFKEVVSDRLHKIDSLKDIEFQERRREDGGFSGVSLVVCDIDHFKSVNDAYGHQVGDEVLKKVAETLKSSVRSGDVVCRWGGEEMVLALFGADKEGAFLKAEQIRQKIEGLSFSNNDLNVTISMGVASSEDTLDFDELFEKADQALYEAKGSGRNKVISS